MRDHGENIVEFAHVTAEVDQYITRTDRRRLLHVEGLSTPDDMIEQLDDDARIELVLAALRRLVYSLGPERHDRVWRSWRRIAAGCPAAKKTGETHDAR